jgi:UPF0176 protein
VRISTFAPATLRNYQIFANIYNMFQVILYYKYVNIKNPAEAVKQQRELCNSLGLKGRILIAKEGINGTLEGTKENILKYCEDFNTNPLFKNSIDLESRSLNFDYGQYGQEKKLTAIFAGDVKIKVSESNGKAFRKLEIKEREEIVASHLPENISPDRITGKYLTAEELHNWYETGKEFYIVDMRNDYETASGYFENSIPSLIENFRYLPEVLPKIEHLKNKTVVTVCTGGVRCEKASGFLIHHGFNNVYQLKDGIVTYMEKYPNEHFKGKLYVFDKRYLVGFNTSDAKHEIVGKCFKCNTVSESYVNCAYDECHKHFICCNNCLVDGISYCSKKCAKIIEAREFKNKLLETLKINQTKTFLVKQFTKRVFKPVRHYFIAFGVKLNRIVD